MTRFLNSLLRALAFIGLSAIAVPAFASNVLVCQPDISGASSGSRTWGGTLSQVPSGTIYTLNSQGCALVASGDVGYFQSQGFVVGAPIASQVTISGALPSSGVVAFKIGQVPAGTTILGIVIQETAGNAITGGVTIGTTTTSGNEIASTATAVAASTTQIVLPSSFLTADVFPTGATIYAKPVTSSNSANVTVTIFYAYY